MKKIFFILVYSTLIFPAFSQDNAQRLIVITSDGVRWQEIFNGLDPVIAADKRYNQGDSAGLFSRFGGSTPEERRRKLMPFVWDSLAAAGRIYGNRNYGNLVDVANPYWFSYPGYSELLTGHVDTAINSNDYPPNPHHNLLEFYHGLPGYAGKVAAFGSWNAFDRILNEKRSQFPVINAFDEYTAVSKSPEMHMLQNMVRDSHKPFGMSECLDVFTHYAALTCLRQQRPKVLYIAYGDTDEFAHHAHYKFYIEAIRQFDAFIAAVWTWVQRQPEYRNRTTLLITTDHGRGHTDQAPWTDHGQAVPGASQTWFMLAGPRVKPGGEIKTPGSFRAEQFAQTVARLTGFTFKATHAVAPAIAEIVK